MDRALEPYFKQGNYVQAVTEIISPGKGNLEQREVAYSCGYLRTIITLTKQSRLRLGLEGKSYDTERGRD